VRDVQRLDLEETHEDVIKVCDLRLEVEGYSYVGEITV
jgi:hypothetical protein